MIMIIMSMCFFIASNISYAMNDQINQSKYDCDVKSAIQRYIDLQKTSDTIATMSTILDAESSSWSYAQKGKITRFMVHYAIEKLFEKGYIKDVQSAQNLYKSYYISVEQSLNENNAAEISEIKKSFCCIKEKHFC